MKIGQKMMMISVHSSGQPSRKIIICAMNWNPIGERFMLSTQRSISPWPPCRANTAELSAQPERKDNHLRRELDPRGRGVRAQPPARDQPLAAVKREHGGEERRADE